MIVWVDAKAMQAMVKLGVLGALLLSALAQQSLAQSEQGAIAEQVEQAFLAARTDDFGPSSALQQHGRMIAPYLAPYVTDHDEDVRRQVVALLGLMGGEEALPLLATALTDPSPDIRWRAAVALYERDDPVALAAHPDLGAALRRSVALGNDSAAAILLLGYFPDADSSATLQKLRLQKATVNTELQSWSPVVPLVLPVYMALSRLGDNEARLALLAHIEAGKLNELAFMLETIRDINSPLVLQALKVTLADRREIAGSLPSGIQPQRRLADLAVNAFVGLLKLDIDFVLSEARRFTQAEIDQVGRKIDAVLP